MVIDLSFYEILLVVKSSCSIISFFIMMRMKIIFDIVQNHQMFTDFLIFFKLSIQ